MKKTDKQINEDMMVEIVCSKPSERYSANANALQERAPVDKLNDIKVLLTRYFRNCNDEEKNVVNTALTTLYDLLNEKRNKDMAYANAIEQVEKERAKLSNLNKDVRARTNSKYEDAILSALKEMKLDLDDLWTK